MSRRLLFPKPYADAVARLRVPSGFLLLMLFLWLSRPSLPSLYAGLPVAIVGLVIRAWAAGHLAKNQRLATTGPYAYVRNPLYIGTATVATGFVIAAREPILALIFAAVFLLVYLPVIQSEEQHLRDLFPEYAPYAEAVASLRPRTTPFARGRFQSRLYWRNQEYNALLGFLAATAFLFWKAI